MREEDKFDKQRFKQMVKSRHQEAKKKKAAADGEQEQFDEFGSDDSDAGPDMSWLPDPDKVYGQKDDEDDDDDDDDKFGGGKYRQVVNSSDESSEEEEIHVARKLVTKKKRAEDDDVAAPQPLKKAKKFAAKLSVNEAEALAMQLLGGSGM